MVTRLFTQLISRKIWLMLARCSIIRLCIYASVRITSNDSLRIVVMITEAMCGDGVRFSVKQTSTGSSSSSDSDIWTADNFAVFGGNYNIEQISEDFDPIQNCNWIEKSNATVTVCLL